jgi:hypothetical protein
LPADVVTAILDITSNITAESVNPYDAVKQALLQCFTSSALQRCFQLLVAPPLGDRNIAAHYSSMRSLIPADADVLFNSIFLRTLPTHISTALASKAELPSAELAAAASQMQHTVAAKPPPPLCLPHRRRLSVLPQPSVLTTLQAAPLPANTGRPHHTAAGQPAVTVAALLARVHSAASACIT